MVLPLQYTKVISQVSQSCQTTLGTQGARSPKEVYGNRVTVAVQISSKAQTCQSSLKELLEVLWGLVLGTSSDTEKEKLGIHVYPFVKVAVIPRSQDPGVQLKSPVIQLQKKKKQASHPLYKV